MREKGREFTIRLQETEMRPFFPKERKTSLRSPRPTQNLRHMKSFSLAAAAMLLAFAVTVSADWTVTDGPNETLPGRKVDIKDGTRLVAQFIHGEGQLKPYLHVFGDEGDLLTEWDAKQQFPHHRGIYIGWNKITSDLGSYDLWHLNNGGKMSVVKFEKLEGGKDSATLVATIEWRGGPKGQADTQLILTETRTLVLSRPAGQRTQVDARFVLHPARDLTLGGDLQHAGIHFRGSAQLLTHTKETSYLWQPDLPGTGGKVVATNAQWVRLHFPVGDRWYAATEFTAPSNPVEEISWRDYGRFGFFFKRALKKDEKLSLNYRFITERAEAPEAPGKPSTQQKAKARAEAQSRHDEFAKGTR